MNGIYLTDEELAIMRAKIPTRELAETILENLKKEREILKAELLRIRAKENETKANHYNDQTETWEDSSASLVCLQGD